MGRKALSVKDLTTSPSLTTLQSEGSRTKHVSFLDTPEVKIKFQHILGCLHFNV